MIVACPKCKTKFRVPKDNRAEVDNNEKILKCGNCHHMWKIAGNSLFAPVIKTHLPTDPELIDSLSHNAPSTMLRDVYATRMHDYDYQSDKVNRKMHIIFVSLLVIYFALVILNNKNTIISKVPLASSVLSIFGLHQTEGLEFSDVNIVSSSLQEGKALVISGYVLNNSNEILKSPDMRISFLDNLNNELVVVRTDLPNKNLEPQERSRITHRIRTVPENTHKIALDLGNYLEFLVR